jgi:general secretion pathway protein F
MKALDLARDSLGLPQMRRSLEHVGKLVRSGQPLSAALVTQGVFDATATSLISVGEQSGDLPTMLRSLAALYEESGQQRMKRFLLLLEPAAIIFIGGVIGGVVTAIMLAITSVNQVAL